VVEADCVVHAGVRLYPHCYISRFTTLERGCQVHPFAIVGHLPQDLAFSNEPSSTIVGENSIIREHVSIHRGTKPGSKTIVGKRCFLMATSHVAHNCVLGDDVKLANSALLAGYVSVGDGAFISGGVVAHQFSRIGAGVMTQGNSTITQDILPFAMYVMHGVVGINSVGLRRSGATALEREEVKQIHELFYRSGLSRPEALARVQQIARSPRAQVIADFVAQPSRRGYSIFVPRSAYMRRVRSRASGAGEESIEE
jgi:UDP-N-acetylglucosamine acyltransferase